LRQIEQLAPPSAPAAAREKGALRYDAMTAGLSPTGEVTAAMGGVPLPWRRKEEEACGQGETEQETSAIRGRVRVRVRVNLVFQGILLY
jgi:hypothetical protein